MHVRICMYCMYCIVWYGSVLYCIILYCMVLYCITLYLHIIVSSVIIIISCVRARTCNTWFPIPAVHEYIYICVCV